MTSIKREKMSSVDTAWLRMDRPTNLMMIVAVFVFGGHVDYGRLAATITARMAPFRRFRQRVVVEPTGAYWEDDPAWDIAAHLHRVALPGAADKSELERFVADLASQPLDATKPLWQFTLIENYQGGSALVARIHHCIADGIALVGVMLKLTDATPDAPPVTAPPAPAETEAPDAEDEDLGLWKQLLGPVTAAAVRTIGVSGDALAKYLEVLAQPDKATQYARVAGSVAGEIAQILAMPDDSTTRYKGKPGVAKVVSWCEPLPLDVVKAVGHVAGASVNDVLLSCVAGALRGYLIERGDDPTGVEIRAMIPVNLRRPGNEYKLGNRFGLVVLTLPLGIANPLERLAVVRARMEALKDSYQAPVTLGVLSLIGMAPKALQTQALDVLARKATAVMTNVPGPRAPLYMAGARLDEIMFWVPQSGDIGIGVSILSYAGRVQFGLVTDRGFVPDPARIVQRFDPEFERLLLTVLQCPRGVTLDPRKVEEQVLGLATPPAKRPQRTRSAKPRAAASKGAAPVSDRAAAGAGKQSGKQTAASSKSAAAGRRKRAPRDRAGS